MRFELSCGAFSCGGCGKGVPASEITYSAVRSALKGELFPERDGNLRALRLLSAYFSEKTGAEPRSFTDLFDMI